MVLKTRYIGSAGQDKSIVKEVQGSVLHTVYSYSKNYLKNLLFLNDLSIESISVSSIME